MEKKFEEKPYPQLRETLISQLSLLTLAAPPHSDNTLSLQCHHLISTKPHLTLLGNHCLLSLKYASSLSPFFFLLSSFFSINAFRTSFLFLVFHLFFFVLFLGKTKILFYWFYITTTSSILHLFFIVISLTYDRFLNLLECPVSTFSHFMFFFFLCLMENCKII